MFGLGNTFVKYKPTDFTKAIVLFLIQLILTLGLTNISYIRSKYNKDNKNLEEEDLKILFRDKFKRFFKISLIPTLLIAIKIFLWA
jgi:hypothetical protein